MGNLFKLILAQLIANGLGGWLARRSGRTMTVGANLPPGPPPAPPIVIDLVDGPPSLPPAPPVAPALTDEIEIL